MPHYDYDKDYPFAAFITNLGKYNEGALVGEWVKFPTTAEELKKVFERIGIGAKDDFGQTYEEWFITDYDCYVDGLYDLLGEYANLDELNYLASKLDDMSQDEYERFQAAMEIGDHTGSIQELINLTENLDCYDVYPDIHDHDDLGRYYIEELDAMQVPEHLRNYIDYEAYGRDIALEESGQFTDLGYVRDTGDSFHEYYDGERGSIPEEYRVMTFQDDIPEEEISEWAMDLAYDMDEFFRQHDPQYAAEHPEEHAAKEEIYDNLMAGRIAALDEKLAALGQTQEDYLPSEIEKFKDATGYEEFLDFDPAVIREAIQNSDKSHADEMLAFAEQAGREYEAELAGQTPAPSPDDRETGETVPNPETLKLLSRLFDVSINTLLASPRQLVCQCCGMPLDASEDMGSNADGSPNRDYCRWCYQRGAFTAPEATVEDMIAFDLKFNEENGHPFGPQEEAERLLRAWLPTLKRWRK